MTRDTGDSTHVHSHKPAVFAVIHCTMTISQATRHRSGLRHLGVDNRRASNTVADRKIYWRNAQNEPSRWARTRIEKSRDKS